MPSHIDLRVEAPAQHYVRDLAPRVMGDGGAFVGYYGYALCLTGTGQVRVLWDEERDGAISEDVDPRNLIFFEPRTPTPASEPGAPGNDEPDERHDYEA